MARAAARHPSRIRPEGDVAREAGWVVLSAALGLVMLGLVMVYSTSSALGAVEGRAHTALLIRQARWVVLGVLVAWVAAVVPLSWLRRAAAPAMGVALEIRPALLTAKTSEERMEIALDGILRSIKHMDGSARLW